MRTLRYFLYELQYAKFTRCLPFYLVRHNGIGEFYIPYAVDQAITIYGFNRRFSPIGYALLCQPEDFIDASERYHPCPTREYLRQRIARSYFRGNTTFGIYELMKMSLYKTDWSDWDETGSSINEEYWGYMGEFELLKEKKSALRSGPGH